MKNQLGYEQGLGEGVPPKHFDKEIKYMVCDFWKENTAGKKYTVHQIQRLQLFFFFFFFQVQPYNRKYRSIGHWVWSNILTELSVNLQQW